MYIIYEIYDLLKILNAITYNKFSRSLMLFLYRSTYISFLCKDDINIYLDMHDDITLK